MNRLVLKAPLAGWILPLAEVPDPVFAQGMMGEGFAIDPVEGRLVAPCAATVLKVHVARHAVTLRAANGAEILLHLGLDTVALGGAGFEACVTDGQAVGEGELLVRFDLDAVAQKARSLVSPILVTNPEGFAIEVLAQDRAVAEGEPVLALTGAAAAAHGPLSEGRTLGRRVRITHAHGLHARPAARIAAEAKRWPGQVLIAAGGKLVQARSPLEIMALGVRAGDEMELRASGPDAEAALAAVEKVVADINAEPAPVLPPEIEGGPAGEGGIAGVRASPGLAIGPAWRLKSAEAPVSGQSHGAAIETAALAKALAFTRGDIVTRMTRLSGEARAVLEAHLALLEDEGLTGAARRRVLEGAGAGAAWREAVDANVRSLQGAGDARLAERAIDLKDLEQRVLWALSGQAPPPPDPPRGAVLMAEDLLPGDLAAMADAGLAGLCTAAGGPTSHVAILAQAMDLPALVAAGEAVLEIADGTTVLLDADQRILDPAPDPDRLAQASRRIAQRKAEVEATRKAAAGPARTSDGVHIAVFANLGSVEEAQLAARSGADGCGLLRTEFLFLDRGRAPTDAEQLADYQAIATALGGKPLTIRTLDVGGDKPAPYLGLPTEENPALGVRGVRVSLRRPELLTSQIKAILGVRPQGQARIMVPMITGLDELARVRRAVADAGGGKVQVGAMIETPAAAATTDLIAAEADFFSIGTNDLAQYVLAMDRGNPALAGEVDALHPAVLRLIRMTIEGARAHGRPVAVCGGLAADLDAVPILVGLGVTELSVPPARVPAVKALVRILDARACRALAARACDQVSAANVRALKIESPKPRRARKGASA